VTITARILSGDRLHLQHGPSDLIIWAEGAREVAYRAATKRFSTIIGEIVSELPVLQERMSPLTLEPRGQVARRMHAACLPFRGIGYLTRMAAVAGSVADEILFAMRHQANLSKAYVNNGGDIALYLGPGTSFSTAIKGHDNQDLARIDLKDHDEIRGIATSGRHGRSHSLGIADSVTVLAKSAASADVAATLIANAVDLPDHPGITRCAAHLLDEGTDLGECLVVTGCKRLNARECTSALSAGNRRAVNFERQDLISAAAIFLQGYSAISQTHLFTATKDPTYVWT
jgi:ApbE superfamily uncharacterized protein (UPF0280 family)